MGEWRTESVGERRVWKTLALLQVLCTGEAGETESRECGRTYHSLLWDPHSLYRECGSLCSECEQEVPTSYLGHITSSKYLKETLFP